MEQFGFLLTRVLRQSGPDADLQRFARRLQHRHISLTLIELDLARTSPTQEAPVLLLQLQLQSEQHENSCEVHDERSLTHHQTWIQTFNADLFNAHTV